MFSSIQCQLLSLVQTFIRNSCRSEGSPYFTIPFYTYRVTIWNIFSIKRFELYSRANKDLFWNNILGSTNNCLLVEVVMIEVVVVEVVVVVVIGISGISVQ